MKFIELLKQQREVMRDMQNCIKEMQRIIEENKNENTKTFEGK